MDALTILRQELTQAHELAEQAVADLSPDHLRHRADGATIQSIATIYAHCVMSEDYLVAAKFQDRPLLFERDAWQERVRIGMVPFGGDPEPWLASIPGADFGALRDYAAEVYAETDRHLATLSEPDLDRTIVFLHEMPVGTYLGTVVAWHAAHHAGEICALKGVLGKRGLPF